MMRSPPRALALSLSLSLWLSLSLSLSLSPFQLLLLLLSQNGEGAVSAFGSQSDGVTKLRFTRRVDVASHPVSLSGFTYVNWAYGDGNDFEKHAVKKVRTRGVLWRCVVSCACGCEVAL
jgi:hypothetical protein